MGKGRKNAKQQVAEPSSKVTPRKEDLHAVDTDENDEHYEPVNYSNEIISKQTSKTLLYLMFYSTLMFTLPFGAFYGTRYILEHEFSIVGFANTGFSVLAAVVVVNAVILAYAYHAYHETEYDNQGNRLDPTVATVPKIKAKKLKPSKEL